jgi:hypothetical protein
LSPRRQQLVTALLVGTVVIVLGVASGIGVDTRTSAAPATVAPTPVPTTSQPAVSAPSRTPINYVGVGTDVPQAPAVVVPTTPPSAPVSPVAVVTRPAPPSSSVAPRPVTTPVPTCPPALLGGLLDALLGQSQTLPGGVLGLVRNVLGADVSGGVGGLFGLLTGPPTTSAGSGLLSVVTDLLPGVLAHLGLTPAPAQRALAVTCTNQISGTLPLLAGLA